MDRHEITERALPFLLRRLHDAGISATPHVDSHTGDIYLKVDGWRRINVENLIDELTQTDPSKHEVTIERWVAFIMESGRIAEQSVTDPDELRQRVRTRIIPANLAANPHLSYARPFPGGLALALCLDFPNTVTTVSNGHLEKYPLSLDELYHWGQINTDNEAIDEHTTCGPFTGIAGESLFIASKAAHIASLVSTLHIDAPHGLLFAIPDRSVLLYAPADQRRQPINSSASWTTSASTSCSASTPCPRAYSARTCSTAHPTAPSVPSREATTPTCRNSSQTQIWTRTDSRSLRSRT